MAMLSKTISLALVLALMPCPVTARTPSETAQVTPVPLVCTSGDAVTESPPVIPPPVQDYEPAPALWKLSDEDTTIHIFGTYHILPKGFRWRTPLFDRVVTGADEVVFESRSDKKSDKPDEVTVEKLKFMTLMLQRRSTIPLSERLAERNRPKLARMLELANIPPGRLEFAPPLMTLFAIALATSKAEGSERELGVESVIEAEFKASGRPISAIEDPIAVLASLLDIDDARLITMLDEGFDEWDGCHLSEPDEVDWTTEHSWAQGKLDETSLKEMMEDPFFKAFYQVLLIDRNRAWTEWLTQRMDQPGNLLLAVGAGHMAGPDSVILMLEARGFKVERIQ